MPYWEPVETEYEYEDETVNFGPRNVVQNKNSLYESSSVCTFNTKGKAETNPCVHTATSSPGVMCVAIDNTITVFEDEMCTKTLFAFIMEGCIDCCALSEDGSMITVADNTGTVVFFTEKGKLFERSLSVNPCSRGCCFADVILQRKTKKEHTSYIAVVVGCCGDVHRICWNVPFYPQSVAMTTEKHTFSDEVRSAAMIPGLSTIFLCNNDISIWSSDTFEAFTSSTYGLQPFKKCCMWKERLLVCLTVNGSLAVFCRKTLLCCAVWNDASAQDFVLRDKCFNESGQYVLTITKPSSEGSAFILCATLPDFTVLHKFKTSSHSWLMSGSSEIMYIEGLISKENIDRIKINVLSRSYPQQRLEHLLKKKCFDEAESFAHKFNLDVSLVYKHKALHFIKILTQQSDKSALQDLTAVLEKISDFEFISWCCVENNLYDMCHTKAVLLQGKKLLTQKPFQDKGEEIDCCVHKIHTKLLTIETLEVIYANETLDGSKSQQISNISWLKFCCQLLLDGRLPEAMFIWQRHLQLDRPTAEDMNMLLISANRAAFSPRLMTFLQSVTLYVLRWLPEALSDLAEWAMQFASALEKNKREWPAVGMAFIGQLTAVITDSLKSAESKASSFAEAAVETLTMFLHDLEEIKTLQDVHHIAMPLKVYLQKDKLSVAQCVLEKVSLQDIDRVLAGFMAAFARKHRLQMDSVLVGFVQRLCQLAGNWSMLKVSHWEPVVAVYVRHIQSTEDKLDCILSILKLASFPWSETIDNLSNEAAKLNHPKISEVERLRKLVSLKLLFRKYSLDSSLLNNKKQTITLLLIKNIVHQGHEDMLADALFLAGNSAHLQNHTYALCLEHYIKKGDVAKALDLLISMPQSAQQWCCWRIVWRIWTESDALYSDTYMELFVSASAGMKDCSLTCNREDMRNILQLKHTFGWEISLRDYNCAQRREEALGRYAAKVAAQFKQGPQDAMTVCRTAGQFAGLLRLPAGDGLLLMYELLLASSSVSVAWRDVAGPDTVCSEKRLHSLCEDALAASKLPLRFAHELVVQSFLQDHLRLNDTWLQVLAFVNRFQTSGLTAEEHHGLNLLSIFHDNLTPLHKSAITCLIQRHFISTHGKCNVTSVLEDLPRLMSILNKRNSELVLVTILNMVYWNLRTRGLDAGVVDVTRYLDIVLVGLFQKVLLSPTFFDITLALEVLFSLNSDVVKQKLHECVLSMRSKYQKLERVCKLGILYCKEKNLIEEKENFKSLMLECVWARKLRKLDIVCDDSFVEKKMEFAKKMILHESARIDLAKEFCLAFGLNIQDILLECLERTLHSWEPLVEVTTNIGGQQEATVVNNEDETLQKCLRMCENINKRQLELCLQSIRRDLNYYNYEMYLCIDAIKEKVLGQTTEPQILLLFLKNYPRTRPAAQKEKEIWHEKFSHARNMPPISQWRLPFWPQDIIWDAIEPELSLDTYEQWLEAAAAVNISSDNICCITLAHVCDSNAETNERQAWCVTSKNELLVRKIEVCVRRVTNLERACAALLYIVSHFSPGADQIKLAEIYCKLTKQWVVASNGDKRYLAAAKKTYLDLATTHILHSFHLGDACYLTNISNPGQLIRNLYHDERILEKARGIISTVPDFTTAITKIATLHGFNLTDLQNTILEEWLNTGAESSKFDETISLSPNFKTTPVCSQNEDDNFLRACYLVKCKKLVGEYLITVAFEQQCEYSNKFKHRALCCLTNVLTLSQLANNTGKHPDFIKKYMQNLAFSSSLEDVGYVFSVSQFEECHKNTLVATLVTDNTSNLPVLKLAVQIALAYSLSSEVWGLLLRCIMRSTMIQQLEFVLLQSSCSSSVFIEAWNYLLGFPFYGCCSPLSEEQRAGCLRSIQLLQRCPVASSVDCDRLARRCLELGCPHWAAAFLPHTDQARQPALKADILSKKPLTELVKELEELGEYVLLTRILSYLRQ